MEPIKVYFGESFIQLNPDGNWGSEDAALSPQATAASLLSKPPFYEYSLSHGAWGFLLAMQVAATLGGKVVLPQVPKVAKQPEGVVI